jgi:hypothetical protein
MPTYAMTAPNGKTYQISGPPGATDEQVRAEILREFPDAGAAAPPLSWADVGSQAIQNIPGSAVEFGKGIVQAVTSPVQTAGAMLDVAAGGAALALPTSVRNFLAQIDSNPKAMTRAMNAAQQFGGVYKQRYGSVDALKRTIANDPVGATADLSMVLSGGAAATRGAAAATAKAAPGASAAAAKTANAMTQAAAMTNPINALAKPGRAVAKSMRNIPPAVQRFFDPKGAAYMEATEGRAADIVRQLRSPSNEMVRGSYPTAAQAASPLGVTKFSALGASAAKVLPTEFFARGTQQQAARGAAIQGIGGAADDLTKAIAARKAAASPLYKQAEARRFAADPTLLKIADDPYVKQALPDAIDLSKSQNISFSTNPTLFVHNVKISLDKMLARTGDSALARAERSQVMDVKNRLVKWLEAKAPEYKQARETFASKSKPINQMEVGQYLEGKLKAPLGTGERAGVFATAVADAPGTIKRATTNEARFKALTDILEPDQVRVVEAIRDDLARAAATKVQAQKGTPTAPKVDQLASAAGSNVRLPNLLSRVTAVANDIMSRLVGKIDSKLAIQLATEMLDPNAAAAAIEKAVKSQRAAKNVGRVAAAPVRAAGKVAKAPATLAGERVQNAMSSQTVE